MDFQVKNSILSELQWDEGLSIPVANEENKLLEDEVVKKTNANATRKQQEEELDDRTHAMSQHMKNIDQELQHTVGILNATRNETETERHLAKITEREQGRLKQEIIRLNKCLEDLKEKKNFSENIKFRLTQNIEDLKSTLKMNQSALEQWLEESAQKDDDAMALEKYSRIDEGKIKELTLQMHRLTDDAKLKKKQLDNETTETLTAQLALDKIAEEFRKAHIERHDLIERWQHTIELMHKRDKEMDILNSQLRDLKSEVQGKEDNVKEKIQFHENEVANNRELEEKISMAEKQASKIRIEYQDMETLRIQFFDELDVLKKTVDRTATDLEVTRCHVTELKKDAIDKSNRLKKAKELRETLVEKLRLATESTLTAEEQAEMMDELLKKEEKMQKNIATELKLLRSVQIHREKELFENREEEKIVEATIQRSHATLKNFNSKINKLDNEAVKQQEILYNQDFAIHQLEHRISNMHGDKNTDELGMFELKIKGLTKDLNEIKETYKLLTSQIKQLLDDIHQIRQSMKKETEAKSLLLKHTDDILLHNDSSEKLLKTLTSKKQDTMVDENICKLEIKRLQKLLHEKANKVLSLEKWKVQLKTAMRERQHEIDVHTKILLSEMRLNEEEHSHLTKELNERISKIDKLKNRYDILMITMEPPEGEEKKSQAYYVIKAAQEKEELQQKGDKLDALIRKAEKEIIALENTLKLLNSRNETYRKSFKTITEYSDEMEEKQKLEEHFHAIVDKYKYKRRQIKEIHEDIQSMKIAMEGFQRDEDSYLIECEDKQNKLIKINKEIDDLQIKTQRASKQVFKHVRELRSRMKSEEPLPEEKDFEVRELREFNKKIINQIGDVIKQHPDVADTIRLYFSQVNISLPDSGTRQHSSMVSVQSASSSVTSASHSEPFRITSTGFNSDVSSPHLSPAVSEVSSEEDSTSSRQQRRLRIHSSSGNLSHHGSNHLKLDYKRSSSMNNLR